MFKRVIFPRVLVQYRMYLEHHIIYIIVSSFPADIINSSVDSRSIPLVNQHYSWQLHQDNKNEESFVFSAQTATPTVLYSEYSALPTEAPCTVHTRPLYIGLRYCPTSLSCSYGHDIYPSYSFHCRLILPRLPPPPSNWILLSPGTWQPPDWALCNPSGIPPISSIAPSPQCWRGNGKKAEIASRRK